MSRVALRGTKPAVAEETQRVGLSRCALEGWFVCLQGSLRLGPAAAQGGRIGLAIERGAREAPWVLEWDVSVGAGARDGPWVLDGMSRVALRGTKPAVAEETQRVGLSRCALEGWFVCLQGSLRLGPAAAQGGRIGLAIERGAREAPWVLDGMSRAALCGTKPAVAQGQVNWSGEGVGYPGMNGLCRAETASAGTISVGSVALRSPTSSRFGRVCGSKRQKANRLRTGLLPKSWESRRCGRRDGNRRGFGHCGQWTHRPKPEP